MKNIIKKKGKLIVFEGIDGSGKQTQSKALFDSLISLGFQVRIIHFPTYTETFFGKEVADYLNGKFGGINEVDPKLAAMLYAGDRFENRDFLLENLSHENQIIICDRYVSSNIAHHSVKKEEGYFEEFKIWVEKLEFGVYQLPEPDLTIFLDLLPEISADFVLKKEKRSYTEKKQDLHEENQEYLNKVYKAFVKLSSGKEWIRIKCYNDKKQSRSVDEIASDILQAVRYELKL